MKLGISWIPENIQLIPHIKLSAFNFESQYYSNLLRMSNLRIPADIEKSEIGSSLNAFILGVFGMGKPKLLLGTSAKN
jgi:hypothetical protein